MKRIFVALGSVFLFVLVGCTSSDEPVFRTKFFSVKIPEGMDIKKSSNTGLELTFKYNPT